MDFASFDQQANAINPHFLASLVPRLQQAKPLSLGMMGQSRQAAKAQFNATIGSSMQNGQFWALPHMAEHFGAEGLDYGSIFAEQPIAAWHQLISHYCQLQPAPSQGVATHGIAEGLDLLASAHLSQGDAVILPDQVWPNINNLFVQWHQATPYRFAFYNDKGGYNVAALAQQLHQAAKDGHPQALIYLNSPANPNGYVFSHHDRQQLRQILTEMGQKMRLVVLCDEAYMTLSFGEQGHCGPLAEHLYGLGNKVLVYSLTGTSKLLQLFGARAGFIALWHQDEALWPFVAQKLLWLARTRRSFANHVILNILQQALKAHDWPKIIAERNQEFAQRYNAALQAAQQWASQGGWSVYPGGGGYFILLHVGKGQAEFFRQQALARGVGLITEGPDNVRFAFSAVDLGNIPQVFERLAHG